MGCVTRANVGKGLATGPMHGPDPMGCDPVAALGNSVMQWLAMGTQPAPPAGPPPVAPIKSGAPTLKPGSAPKGASTGNFASADKDVVTAGRSQASADGATRTGWVSPSADESKASVSGGYAKGDGRGGKTTTSGGVAWDWTDPLGSLAANMSRARETAVPGAAAGQPEAVNKTSKSLGIGASGLQGQLARTEGGTSQKATASLGPNGAGLALEQVNAKGRGAGVSVGLGSDRQDIAGTYKHSEKASVTLGAHRIDKLAAGASTNPAVAGDAWQVAHTTGGGVNGGLELDSGGLGFGASGSMSAQDVVSFQRSAAGVARDFEPGLAFGGFWGNTSWTEIQKNAGMRDQYLQRRYADRVEGVTGVADADLLGLDKGDGYSFLHQDASEGEVTGRAGALSIGFGDKNLDATRTSIGRDERGWTIRVETSSSDADIQTASLFKILGGSETLTTGNGGAVQLNIDDGPEGRAALQLFTATGLLPGAEKLADPKDPDRMLVESMGPMVAAMRASGAHPMMYEAMQRTLYAASGRLNARVLGASGTQMLDQAPAGVTYGEHTQSRTRQDDASLSLLGKAILSSGTTENWWETDYREEGKRQTEHGYGRDEEHYFAPDESTGVAVNPKDPRLAQQGVELVLHSLQETSGGQRKIVDRVGAAGMDPAMRAAWVKGQVHDGERTRMAMVLTGDQLDTIRDRLGPQGDDFKQLRADANKALADWANPAGAMMKTNTAREVMRMGEGPMAMFAGRDRAEDLIAKVGSAKDFDALGFDEKRKFLIFASQGAQYRDEWKSKGTDREHANPWRALPLALREQDPKKRGELVRTMFESIEGSSIDSTTALVQLVDFLDQDGKAAGLSAEDRKSLVAGLAVQVEDGRVDSRAKALAKSPETAGKAVADGLLSDGKRQLAMNDRRFTMDFTKVDAANEANRGDAMVDWLLAADQAGGTALTDGVQGALARDPKLVERILANTRHEPWRQETARNLLRRAGVKV